MQTPEECTAHGDNTYGQIGDNTKESTNYFKETGYTEITHEEKIKLNEGEQKELQDFNYSSVYFNVFKEDKVNISLKASAEIVDETVAGYSDGIVTGRKVGTTMLTVKEEETGTIIYIPVEVTKLGGGSSTRHKDRKWIYHKFKTRWNSMEL